MKFLILVFLSAPVFACKMDPKSAQKSDEIAAINAVKKKTSAKHVKIMAAKGHFLVRSTKPSCVEYKVKTARQPDCKVTADILSERACP